MVNLRVNILITNIQMSKNLFSKLTTYFLSYILLIKNLIVIESSLSSPHFIHVTHAANFRHVYTSSAK